MDRWTSAFALDAVGIGSRWDRSLVLDCQLAASTGRAVASEVLEHGEAELDTNLVENAIRPTAIGKKNFLFIGHKDAGQRSAIIYSLIQSCRIIGIDPYAYLKDVLERIPGMTNQNVEELIPIRWAQKNRLVVQAAA